MPTSTTNPDSRAAASGTAPADGLCFLVAEDHEFQRGMMVGMLEDLGASAVYEAEDGTLHYQRWRDVAAVGGLVDPETGDDLELVGWTL